MDIHIKTDLEHINFTWDNFRHHLTDNTLDWYGRLTFSNLKQKQYISLPGLFTYVQLLMINGSSIHKINDTMKAVWIDNTYSIYKYFSTEGAKLCVNKGLDLIKRDFKNCMSFSNKFYIFSQKEW